MSNKEKNPLKYPQLREDLKISKMVNKSSTHYVVKDPLKEKYYRFSDEEWGIIELYNGENTYDDMVEKYNQSHPYSEIDRETLENYRDELDGMKLLFTNQKDMNVMLVEKVREMREFQLLSKKGSLLYKRFPVIDPDKLFDKWIPYLRWVWSKQFFIISALIMLGACLIIATRWTEVTLGASQIFSFSGTSFSHLALLWLVIYITIAIHEFGHGLTCKYYGGEVHEIGFLLLFFQPCLYCNVNDAWLFDKKWKQIMVTLAGGYIEFFIGSICAYIWALSSPNTFINIISFQVMTICSVSTVLFNFNPLIKLDGYYLLSDFLEVPNLKEDSSAYLKYFVSTKIFKMKEPPFEATKRQKRVYLGYGIASSLWMFLLLTGLIGMAMGLLTDKLYYLGVIITVFIAYKLFGGHVKSSGEFMKNWAIFHNQKLRTPKMKVALGLTFATLLISLFIPVHYKIHGEVSLAPHSVKIIRAEVEGQLKKFHKLDGEKLMTGDLIAEIDNPVLSTDRDVASLALLKERMKLRKTLVNSPNKKAEQVKNLKTKRLEFNRKEKELAGLQISWKNSEDLNTSILSCEDQTDMIGTFVKKGDEICRALRVDKMKTTIEVSEQQVRFLQAGQAVKFKLISSPEKTYQGHIASILPTGKTDPKNPTKKIYQAQIQLENSDRILRPGMQGVAKIFANKELVIKYAFIKLSEALRMDLFY